MPGADLLGQLQRHNHANSSPQSRKKSSPLLISAPRGLRVYSMGVFLFMFLFCFLCFHGGIIIWLAEVRHQRGGYLGGQTTKNDRNGLHFFFYLRPGSVWSGLVGLL